MDIYEQIDTIFSGEAENKPQWANEILSELKEIKVLLKEQKQTTQKIDKNFYSFIKEFRVLMRADTTKNIYPTFNYDGRRFGVDFKGLLYDKENSKFLSTDEAYKVYKYAYNQRDRIEYSA